LVIFTQIKVFYAKLMTAGAFFNGLTAYFQKLYYFCGTVSCVRSRFKKVTHRNSGYAGCRVTYDKVWTLLCDTWRYCYFVCMFCLYLH